LSASRAVLALAAAALLGGGALPANAITCTPRVRPHTYVVGEVRIEAYEFYMVC
jgi:hypothetical protein